jgi:hypothetical protein
VKSLDDGIPNPNSSTKRLARENAAAAIPFGFRAV